VNKLLILVFGLIFSTSTLALDNNIYVSSKGDLFQFKSNKLRQVDTFVQKNMIELQKAILPKNELSAIFQALKVVGCRKVHIQQLSNFSPYNNFEHFSQYFEVLRIDKKLIAIVDKNIKKIKTVGIYNRATSSLCSTGIYTNAVFFNKKTNDLYFAKCDKGNCITSWMNGDISKAKPNEIATFKGDVIDMGYDNQSFSIITLVRKLKKKNGLFSSFFSNLGHGRDDYDLYIYKYNTKTGKIKSHLIGKDVTNPTFWIEQSWLTM